MKKFFIVLFLLFVVGCSSSEINEDYFDSKNILKTSEENIMYDNYDLRIILKNYSDSEYIYNITLDNVVEPMNNVRILSYHNAQTINSFPSVGYFDNPISLGEPFKGINLVGYIEKDSEFDHVNFKVLVENEGFKNIHELTIDRK